MRTTFISGALGCALFLGLVTLPTRAAAHGINGHVWVTDGGLAFVTDCTLAVWLADEAYRPILQIGASFPDSGYALDIGRDYAETAHWEPFVEAYIRYLRERHGPPYDTEEARRLIAFLFGLSAHGMQDEVFDTIFMTKAGQVEGSGQDILDPGTDFMLVADEVTNLKPEVFLPAGDLIAIFARPDVGVTVTASQMESGMTIVRNAVILLVDQDDTLDDEYRPMLPWTAEHYLDQRTPGSLEYEKTVGGPYYESLWRRLHGDFRYEDLVVQTVPLPGSRTLSTSHLSIDSWPHLIFGYGVHNGSLNSETVALLDEAGVPVAADIRYTRWGGADDVGRILQLRPQADLRPDAEYVIVLKPGVRFVDGRVLDRELRYAFRTACDAGAGCAANPLLAGEEPICPPEGSVAGPAPVAGADGGCRSARGPGSDAGWLWVPLVLAWGGRRLQPARVRTSARMRSTV